MFALHSYEMQGLNNNYVITSFDSRAGLVMGRYLDDEYQAYKLLNAVLNKSIENGWILCSQFNSMNYG